MPEVDFDPTPAAEVLAKLWREGGQCQELSASVRPRTLEQGYDVQDRLIAALGEQAIGWKLGVGSFAQKRQSGIGRSIAGRILRQRVHGPNAVVILPDAAPVTVEFEIAYVLGCDVRPDESAFDAMDAVGEARVAFELVRSRFVDRRAVGWPSFVADNAAFFALVLGPVIALNQVEDVARTLSVSLDGEVVAGSLSGEDVTDPPTALADLLALARERGVILPKGSIVSTGSVSRPFIVAAPAASICARFLETELAFSMQTI
jgi:2-keto-4-pentenoate hydratase